MIGKLTAFCVLQMQIHSSNVLKVHLEKALECLTRFHYALHCVFTSEWEHSNADEDKIAGPFKMEPTTRSIVMEMYYALLAVRFKVIGMRFVTQMPNFVVVFMGHLMDKLKFLR